MNKKIFAGLLCTLSLTAIGCTNADVNANAATSINVAVNSVPNTNAAANSAAAQTAQTTTAPDALVAELYKQHDGQNSPFFQAENRAAVDKYFTKSTADIIWKDAVEANGEVGALGADPLYDAQDSDIKNFKVGQPIVTGDKAEVPVTFDNFGKKQVIKFLLAKENGAWKINDLNYGKYTLLSIYKDNAAAMNSQGKAEKSSPGNFEGKYQVGDTTATVKPVKMAFEVKWAKGSGTEMFFSEGAANDKYIFASDPKTGKANVFSFDDENYNTGTFYRADGKEFPIKRTK